MDPHDIHSMLMVSRRRFLTMAGAGAFAAHWPERARVVAQQGASRALTVEAVMARVQDALGTSAPPNSIDGLKAGRLEAVVTGVGVTPIVTIEAIRRAAASRRNLLITFEPTFYARADAALPANRASDPVFAAKRALLDQHGIAVWRLHDRWLARTPDPMIDAFADALGWRTSQDANARHRVIIAPMTLSDLVARVQQRLGARALRVVGDPALRVSRIVLSPGPSAPAVTFGNLAAADVIIAGEPREWEGVEYTQDAIAAGGNKAMIIVGRLLSENAGMKAFADWLPTVLPQVPVEWLPVNDPYWRPAGAQTFSIVAPPSQPPAAPRQTVVTARQVVDRIKGSLAALNVGWRADTVDTFKAGDPDRPITGIATTFMATFDAIKRSVAAGANFVISHEPTFYNHLDTTTQFTDDATFKAKMAFIEEHHVVVFRFHDHWHAKRPDGMRVALIRALGWPDAPGTVTLPQTTLGALAAEIRDKLKVRAMRVVGDPNARVSRVSLGLGYGNPQLNDNVDVVVTGESQEADSAWDNASYVLDATAAGQPKGLILLGHEQSEARGMDECATWLRTIVTEVPITFIRAGEPFN
jgi:putative NIF3 family GTP cyclohydrolase 1 type 2